MTDRYRVIDAGFDPAEVPPLETNESAFRVRDRLTDDEYRHLGRLLEQRPDAWLHLSDSSPHLEALRHFIGLRHLMVTDLRLESWAGIRHVADTLEDLQMGDTTLKPISITPLADLPALRSLALLGPVRDAEAIAKLTTIEELTLRSVTLGDLAPLLPMRRLRSLRLLLGGTARLDLLPELLALQDLELWRIRGLHDLAVLGELPTLRSLSLQSMTAVTRLPSLAGCVQLRRVVLDTMKGLTDLGPVAAAPRLEELLLIEMPQLSPDDLAPLVGHPALRRGVWGLGSFRKNAAAYDLLPIGDPPYGHPDWQAWIAQQGSSGPGESA